MGNITPIVTTESIFEEIDKQDVSEPTLIPLYDDESRVIHDLYMNQRFMSQKTTEMTTTINMNYCMVGVHKRSDITVFYFEFGKTLYMLLQYKNPHYESSLDALRDAKMNKKDGVTLKMTIQCPETFSEYVWVTNVDIVDQTPPITLDQA